MDSAVSDASRGWAQLEAHFELHATLFNRFRNTPPRAVIRMWEKGTNEIGEPLTPYERHALVERHCELFGNWPRDWLQQPESSLDYALHNCSWATPRRSP